MGRAFLALVVLASSSFAPAAPAADTKTNRASFTGSWALDEASSRDKGTSTAAPRAPSTPPIGGRDAAASMPGSGNSTDIPFEAMVDPDRINVRDDGEKMYVTYLSGRVRTLFLDGEERELDDGGGPAKVVAKRRGANGDHIVVSSRWRVGNLSESWELQSNPPRLVVTGKGKGRQSFSYKRVYVPVSEAEAPHAAAPASPEIPPASSMPGASTASASAAPSPAAPVRAVVWGTVECSIKAPRGAISAELAGLAKITSSDASNRASASVKPAAVTSAISSDVEAHEGCLVFPITVRLADRKGVQEIYIDAGDGKLLGSMFEAD
ncbi:MAG: hypothetical protein ABIT01_04715 [Thermoanaerobaculia bacterium]